MSFFSALEVGEWGRAVSFVDSGQTEAFQERAMYTLAAWAEAQHRAPERHPDSDPQDTSAQDSSYKLLLKNYGQTRVPIYPGAPQLAELASRRSGEFLAQHFAALAAIQREGASTIAERVHLESEVIANDTLARVLYRRSPGSTGNESKEALTIHLHRTEGDWYLLLNDEIAPPNLFVEQRLKEQMRRQP